jgi:hypothetical protein
MRTEPLCRKVLLLPLMLICLVWGLGPAAQAQASPAQPPRPSLQSPQLAPRAARILEQVALAYEPHMSPQVRDRDYLGKVALAKKLLDLTQLLDLRHQSLSLLNNQEPSWETLRLRKWPQGDRVGVVLSVPVWVPSRAQRVPAYAGFEKKWQTVALTQPRPSGYVWFAGKLTDINHKSGYRAERTQVGGEQPFCAAGRPVFGIYFPGRLV